GVHELHLVFEVALGREALAAQLHRGATLPAVGQQRAHRHDGPRYVGFGYLVVGAVLALHGLVLYLQLVHEGGAELRAQRQQGAVLARFKVAVHLVEVDGRVVVGAVGVVPVAVVVAQRQAVAVVNLP
nr:hypothetical protein [Tanacetum cinerariifolium]